MRKTTTGIFLFTFILSNILTTPIFAQYTLTYGKSSVEISGLLATYYNQRFYKDPTNTDFKKDRFSLSSARFKLEGRVSNDYEYQLQLDFSRLGYTESAGEFPAILDVNFTYKKLPVNITVGYQKLPYSRSSLVPFQYQPGWQRAEISRGYIFSRRDLGVTLQKDFWKRRINLMAGVYTGQGEYILTSVTSGDGDANGTPEFVGRAEFSYPCQYKYHDVYDTRKVAKPMFSLGLNGRYVKRTNDIKGLADFDLTLAGGERRILGFDAAAQWKGFSALVEMHQVNFLNPVDQKLLQGKQTNQFNAGGFLAQLAYYNKRIKSGFLVRYDELVPNDLVAANYRMQNLSFCYNYMLNGFRSMLRLQYWYRLTANDNTRFEQKFRDDQLRVGWQLSF